MVWNRKINGYINCGKTNAAFSDLLQDVNVTDVYLVVTKKKSMGANKSSIFLKFSQWSKCKLCEWVFVQKICTNVGRDLRNPALCHFSKHVFASDVNLVVDQEPLEIFVVDYKTKYSVTSSQMYNIMQHSSPQIGATKNNSAQLRTTQLTHFTR